MLKPREEVKQEQLNPSARIQGLETCATPVIDFVNALEARGITLVLRRNRVNAGADQKHLTPEERAFINANRPALKELLQDPLRVKASQPVAPVAEPDTPEQAAQRTHAERDAFIKTNYPDIWRTLHFNDPDEVQRRNAEATAVMLGLHQPPNRNYGGFK